MAHASLSVIKKLLEKSSFNCAIVNKSEAIPIDQLVIELDRDRNERVRLLIIRAIQQDLSENDKLFGIQAKIRSYIELQFFVTLPFQVEEKSIPEVARLILFFNKGMELPGFELSEVDKLIFFRHAFVVPQDDLDERILISLVGMIELLLESFSDTLEGVATGTQTLRDVVNQAQLLLVNASRGSKI